MAPRALSQGLALVALSMLLAAPAAWATSPRLGGRSTLVLVDTMALKDSHSAFFDLLQERGHKLQFQLATSAQVELSRYGDWVYDNIVIFASEIDEFGPKVDAAALTKFVDGGGNVFVAASSSVGTTVREFAMQCGVDFDENGATVVDHINYDVSDEAGDHTLVVTEAFAESTFLAGPVADRKPVLFRGIGQAVNDDNILAAKVLTASPTGYSAFLDEAIRDYPQSIGSGTVLATAIQARNNARVAFVGSSWALSDAAFAASVETPAGVKSAQSGNKAFAQALSRWAFQEAGVLRIKSIAHTRADGSEPEHQLVHAEKRDLPRSMFPEPEIARESLVYRIKDDITYSVLVEQYDGAAWAPFSADDMQVEFVMLDAYVRKTLTATDGVFSGTFKAPDVYGIFKFRLHYRRTGLSVLHNEQQVSVRPFRHNEYERFIESAFPYYAAAFTMMAGFFVFSGAFLYTKSD